MHNDELRKYINIVEGAVGQIESNSQSRIKSKKLQALTETRKLIQLIEDDSITEETLSEIMGYATAAMTGGVEESIEQSVARQARDQLRIQWQLKKGPQIDVKLYHGTPATIQGDFRPSSDGVYGPGIYLTTDPKEAEIYTIATGQIFPHYVRGKLATADQYYQILNRKRDDRVKTARFLQKKGYSGIWLQLSRSDDYAVVIMFSPQDILNTITDVKYDKDDTSTTSLGKKGLFREDGDIRCTMTN